MKGGIANATKRGSLYYDAIRDIDSFKVSPLSLPPRGRTAVDSIATIDKHKGQESLYLYTSLLQ
jgi:hypothetical protein